MLKRNPLNKQNDKKTLSKFAPKRGGKKKRERKEEKNKQVLASKKLFTH